MTSLDGSHALVTGGGTGIGAAIAVALDRAGAMVTLVGRREGPLRIVAGALANSPFVVAADVTDPIAVGLAFDAARAANGPISILVNNAGAAATAPFSKLDFDTWRRVMSVNLDALHHTCQAALPDLRAAAHGRIVNVASTAGLKGYAYTAAYSAAKHGAVGLTRALAMEFALTNLTVNAVCPSFCDTDLVAEAIATIVQRTGRAADVAREDMTRFNPQRRLIDPVEVASAVHWICRPENRSINGLALAISGGEVG
ncbi:SDR family NAD(P)-dependent oxidoreductase [Phenylobacterium sp.]|uniref:SDR family NAD(P)-dependent oxidoreductase n=1 Tax=Phenylobacterium sp. TaxID=1871053 RepID=UPI002FCA5FEE